MFDAIMYIAWAAAMLWLLCMGAGVLLLPLYLWARWRDQDQAA
ncbi:hypothetical protein [Melaminivora sp.]|nr:hypothetical protein [Melaminivora sp.]